jgi:hypothetical protein
MRHSAILVFANKQDLVSIMQALASQPREDRTCHMLSAVAGQTLTHVFLKQETVRLLYWGVTRRLFY